MPGSSARPTACAASSRRRPSTPPAGCSAPKARVDQQDRPCAARPRPGLRRASRTARALAALAADLGLVEPLRVAVDVHLQAAAASAARCAGTRTRPSCTTTPMSVTGFWFALEDATRRQRLPVGRAGRPPRAAARALRARRRRGCACVRLDATPVARRRRRPCRSRSRPARWSCFHGLLPHYSAPNRSAALAPRLHAARHRRPQHLDSPTNWLQRAAGCRCAASDAPRPVLRARPTGRRMLPP